ACVTVTRFSNTISKAERIASGSTRCLRGRPFGFPLWPFWNRPVRGERERSDVSLTLRPPQHAQVRPLSYWSSERSLRQRKPDQRRGHESGVQPARQQRASSPTRGRGQARGRRDASRLDRIGNQRAGLNRRMQGQILAAAALE